MTRISFRNSDVGPLHSLPVRTHRLKIVSNVSLALPVSPFNATILADTRHKSQHLATWCCIKVVVGGIESP